jgi:excisionase family DNA binding protein
MPYPSTDEIPSPLLVRPREAWRLLSCGNTHGYELLAAGELQSFLDGRRRKITVESIRAYIERRLAEAGGAPASTPTAGPPRRRGRSSGSGNAGPVTP